jgi:hypothetical protein
MVPGRAGTDTRVDIHIGLADLCGMDGASLLKETWLAAKAGQHGYLTGTDAQAIACDALIVPVVTGTPDGDAIRQIIYLVLQAHGVPAQDQPAAQPPAAAPRGLGSTPVRPGPPRHRLRVRARSPRLRPAHRAPASPLQRQERPPRHRLALDRVLYL